MYEGGSSHPLTPHPIVATFITTLPGGTPVVRGADSLGRHLQRRRHDEGDRGLAGVATVSVRLLAVDVHWDSQGKVTLKTLIHQ